MVKKRLPEYLRDPDYFRKQGARGAKLQAAAMTPAQRQARAIKASRAAALARTAKRKAAIDAALAQLRDLERKRQAHTAPRTKKTQKAKG